MNTSDLEAAILSALRRLGTLPESDLLHQLAPAQVVRYGPEVLDGLVAAGRVVVRVVGDERVIALAGPEHPPAASSQGAR